MHRAPAPRLCAALRSASWNLQSNTEDTWLAGDGTGHLDLPRMRAGGFAGGFFAIDGVAAGENLISRFKPARQGVWMWELATPIADLKGGKLTDGRAQYTAMCNEDGGIVEERITGDVIRSPSVQLRVLPGGETELLSTHDQLLGGASGQSYLGCRFPAAPAYRREIQAAGLAAALPVLLSPLVGMRQLPRSLDALAEEGRR